MSPFTSCGHHVLALGRRNRSGPSQREKKPGVLRRPSLVLEAVSESKASIEGVNGAFDAIAQPCKDWDNRYSFNRTDLLEGHLDRRIVFHLKFRVRGSPKGNPVDFNAILDSPRILSN
jgi:hypothetical protein